MSLSFHTVITHVRPSLTHRLVHLEGAYLSTERSEGQEGRRVEAAPLSMQLSVLTLEDACRHIDTLDLHCAARSRLRARGEEESVQCLTHLR